MEIIDIVDKEEFIFFLQWLEEEWGWDASEIIDVVQSPHKYRKKYQEWVRGNNEIN